jgi:crotonobetainyl-CoA:carnitine CoA-transferase CaiB-like acyl-CoA transferase
VADERLGELAVPNVMPRLTETPGRIKWLGPSMEAHNQEVYAGMLGLPSAEIERLKAAGVI